MRKGQEGGRGKTEKSGKILFYRKGNKCDEKGKKKQLTIRNVIPCAEYDNKSKKNTRTGTRKETFGKGAGRIYKKKNFKI
jgi:hypothetical protein